MTAHKTSAGKKLLLDFLPIASIPPVGIDLWLLDLSTLSENSSPEFIALVSADELIRARQFKKKYFHFLATRALLRLVLAHYTGLNAQELFFARAEHGKPFLKNVTAEIYFNLSHCDDFAVLAVSAHDEVGVDIEMISERDYMKIAKRYFHTSELDALHSSAKTEQKFLFYKLWTLKETFFKATGGGIASGLDKVFFSLIKSSSSQIFLLHLICKKASGNFSRSLLRITPWLHGPCVHRNPLHIDGLMVMLC